jgi:branched-subunit amino acid aminotransferase/4-amino-4-deoxychorismate lyase
MAQSTGDLPDPLLDTYISVNGTLHPAEEASVKPFDRGLLYSDGVYDAFPFYESKGILGDRHLDRLYRSIAAAKIQFPYEKSTIREWVIEAVTASEIEYGGCRIVVTRGAGPQGISNTNQMAEMTDPTVLVIPSQVSPDVITFPEVTFTTARVVSTRTLPPDVADPKLKGLDYLSNILAQRELLGTDAESGLMLDHQGRVGEATDANVLVRSHEGEYLTPDNTNSLAGVTRAAILERAEAYGYDVRVTDLTPADLFTAEEVILMESRNGITLVSELDGRPIGDGTASEDTVELSSSYTEYVLENEYISIE